MIYIIEEVIPSEWVWSVHRGEVPARGETLIKGECAGGGEQCFSTFEFCEAEVKKINKGLHGVYLMAPHPLF